MKKQLKSLIESMMDYYRNYDHFEECDLNEIVNLSEYQTTEVRKLIQKFYMINTTIAENGGVPVLKQIYKMI